MKRPFKCPPLDLKKHFLLEDILIIPPEISNIILYHGSSDIFKDKIKKGLLPRKVSGNSVYEGSIISQENRVYLARYEIAKHLGQRAVEKFGGNLMIIEVYVNVIDLTVDEDAKNRFGATNWRESLIMNGTCASLKPVNRIKSVIIY